MKYAYMFLNMPIVYVILKLKDLEYQSENNSTLIIIYMLESMIDAILMVLKNQILHNIVPL